LAAIGRRPHLIDVGWSMEIVPWSLGRSWRHDAVSDDPLRGFDTAPRIIGVVRRPQLLA